MKKFTKFALGLSVFVTAVFGVDPQMEAPSSVPINVFQMQDNQIGIGYFQFGTTLELEDDYFGDKIGDAEYDSKGVIVTFPRNTQTMIGKMFELSYTAGNIDSKLKDTTFSDDGKIYNNTYKKDGFYIGVRPVFSLDIYESDMFQIQNSTSIHLMLYTMSGDFTVSHNGGGYSSYGYDETSSGIGVKPTTVINGTFFPIKNLGLTLFGGLTTFVAIDYTSYENKASSFDEDVELTANLSFEQGDRKHE